MSYYALLLPNVLAFPSMLPYPLLLPSPFLSSRLLFLNYNLRCPLFSYSVQSCLFLNSPALYSLFIPNYYNNLIHTCSVGDIDHTSTGTGTGMRMGIGSGSTSAQGQGQGHEFDNRNALLASTFLLSSFPLAPRLIFIFKLYQRLICFSFLLQI